MYLEPFSLLLWRFKLQNCQWLCKNSLLHLLDWFLNAPLLTLTVGTFVFIFFAYFPISIEFSVPWNLIPSRYKVNPAPFQKHSTTEHFLPIKKKQYVNITETPKCLLQLTMSKKTCFKKSSHLNTFAFAKVTSLLRERKEDENHCHWLLYQSYFPENFW